jgi:hypothetical protein
MRLIGCMAMAVVALGCSKAEPRDAKPGAPSSEAAPAEVPAKAPTAVAPSPADGGATHPGTIVFMDHAGNEKARSVREVPESVAWATVGGQRVPVVRVVEHRGGGRIEIVSYGPDGQELARVLGH